MNQKKESASFKDDPDNHFLEVAVECKADYLITGNASDFEEHHPFRGTEIFKPREFLDQVIRRGE